MIWQWLVYLLFAVIHPVSEILRRTNLRVFLNKAYYKTNQEEFPVSVLRGTAGSLAVLVLLVSPVLDLCLCVDWWCLALGVTVADVIQHIAHFVSRPREAGPRVHLATILVVFIFLLLIRPDRKLDLLAPACFWPLIVGALIIFGNWGLSSLLVRRAAKSPGGAA